jgi:WD40 repeat protein
MIVLPDIGLLMSCSYDKNLIVWKYHEERELARLERSEELRCMDYLKSLKTLFVGTNDKIILTISLEEILQGTGDSKYAAAFNKDE